MAEDDAAIEELSRTHRFSADAVGTLVRAMRHGGGTAAQFSHAEFGGMGQWSRGGMLMIGDMFNTTLKERVARLCDDIARQMADDAGPGDEPASGVRGVRSGAWWPDEFGRPASSGAQNDMRYAVFPEIQRLAVHRDGRLELYDTGEHRLSGVSQAQSGGQSLAFSSQHGPVHIEQFRRLERAEAAREQPTAPASALEPALESAHASAPKMSVDSYDGLERLHDLHRKGVLTEHEFSAKKQELLARI